MRLHGNAGTWLHCRLLIVGRARAGLDGGGCGRGRGCERAQGGEVAGPLSQRGQRRSG